jgi:hypothetical protein
VYAGLLLGLGFLVFSRRFVGDELLLYFVGMQEARPLAVGFVDFVLVCGRGDPEEVVE